MKFRNKAFTLIELLVVIAIIGILAGVVIASLNSARAKARDAKRTADTLSLRTALEMYYADNGIYPASADSVFPSVLTAALVPNYIPSIPVDPSGRTYRYYTGSSTAYWVVRVPFETKTECWYYGGVGASSTSNFWGLSPCQ